MYVKIVKIPPPPVAEAYGRDIVSGQPKQGLGRYGYDAVGFRPTVLVRKETTQKQSNNKWDTIQNKKD